MFQSVFRVPTDHGLYLTYEELKYKNGRAVARPLNSVCILPMRN